jgi:multidrug efflux pump subunit AcrA (membrane-fusion protein)
MSTAAPLHPPGSTASASPASKVSGRTAAAAVGSVPQPPDPQLVAEMKQEIRVLVQEIAELAAGDIAPGEFYAGFLTRVVSAMAAVGGALWIKGESGKLKLAYQVNLAKTGAERTPQDRTRHGHLIKSVLTGSQAILVQPGAAGGSEHEARNPTDLLLVLSPLVVEKEAEAVVEVFQRAGGGPSTQRGYLRFLVQMCDVACDYLKSRKLRQLQGSQSLWRELEQLVQELHRSLDLQQTAYAVVNEGRRMIGCDRVSLALAYGGKCRVEAVSGLDSIDRRASEVQRLANLATAVLRTREPLWSEAGQADLPDQIEQPLQAYVDQSHARLVAVLPLVRPGENASPAPIGALIIEQLRDARAGETLRTRSELVAQHSAAALSNAIEHSSVFLLPLWKQLGKATWLVRGRTLPKSLLVLALVITGITALAVVPTEFEVAARGKLQPAQRHEVFAPLDGIVAAVPVRHGQIVEAGAVLAELSSTDIELELASLIGRQTTNQERLAALQRALLDTRSGSARLTPAEENRLGGEMLELRQEAENIERELSLLRQKQQQLTIVARERGQVVTWKVEDLLLHRPVQRGQGLLTLADPDGPWELELYLPERRIKHVQASGRRESPGIAATDVTFTLASHAGQTFHGHIVEIEQAAEVRGEEGNTVLVRVAVEKDELPPLHDQTTVTAKIQCGRTSLGYAWFCDLIETVQSNVLFWLPS